MTKEPVIKKNLYEKLSHDRIELNWNKNPVEMSLFLSFLTVTVERSNDHLGSSTGWTLLFNENMKLKVGGAIYGGKEWLNRLEFGKNLMNPYNNYVNPFYLFDIMTDAGKSFFIDYYRKDIEKIISDQEDRIESLQLQTVGAKNLLDSLNGELLSIGFYPKSETATSYDSLDEIQLTNG